MLPMNLKFLARHPKFCLTDPRRAWATVKAMDAYKKAHPTCEITGKSPVEVHHVKPVEYFPELAADPTNYISLYARLGHLVFGHAGNWKWYVENVREVPALKVVKPNEQG